MTESGCSDVLVPKSICARDFALGIPSLGWLTSGSFSTSGRASSTDLRCDISGTEICLCRRLRGSLSRAPRGLPLFLGVGPKFESIAFERLLTQILAQPLGKGGDLWVHGINFRGDVCINKFLCQICHTLSQLKKLDLKLRSSLK